jgi:hypothetical protein
VRPSPFFVPFLNSSVLPSPGLVIDNPDSDPVLYDAADDPDLSQWEICDDVTALLKAANGFPNNKVRYSLTGFPFPNSNSFIRYLLTFIPYPTGITAPAGAVGWGRKVLGR